MHCLPTAMRHECLAWTKLSCALGGKIFECIGKLFIDNHQFTNARYTIVIIETDRLKIRYVLAAIR